MSENDAQSDEIKWLTAKQVHTIACMLESRNSQEAAKQAGISARTLARWMEQPAFAAAVAESESALIDYAMRRLMLLQDQSVDTIRDLMSDVTKPATVRLRAAGMVLENMIRLRELRQVEARLTALEKLYLG